MIAPRRLVSVPLATAVSAGVLVVSPLLLAASALMALATRSSRPARTIALAMAYAFIELRTLVKLAVGDVDGDRLMRDLLTAASSAARRILDVEVVFDPLSASPESIPRHEPVIVLSRHCGPGDSVMVAGLLTFQYRLQVRIVLKAILRYEPVLDSAGQRGLLCFLARGDRARQQIHDLAASLVGGQALLLFPEGANFTWPRWQSAIAELRETGRIRAAARALRRPYTLPPRSGGAIAAVSGAPSANVGQPERWIRLCRAQLARGVETHAYTTTSLVIGLAAANGLIDAAEATGNPHVLSWALLAYGLAVHDADPVRSLVALRRGLVIAEDSGNRAIQSHVATNLCRFEAEHGDPLAAFDYFTVAIGIYHDSGNTYMIRSPLGFLAAFFDRLGRYEPAATIAGFAVTSPVAALPVMAEFGTAIAHLRKLLGDETYESFARRGETMTTAEIVTYAYGQIDQGRAELNAVSK
jgi:hypothetical protein